MKNRIAKCSKINRLLLLLTGVLAIVWFLIRVIPKPSRAAYPCMRIAYPIASTFVLYLVGLVTSVFALNRMKTHWGNSRYWATAGFFVVALMAGFMTFQADQPPVFANSNYLDTANVPIGVARGIFPGRVVWARNADATNENCANSSFGDAYYLPKNTNMAVVDGMVQTRDQLLQIPFAQGLNMAHNRLQDIVSKLTKKGDTSL